MDSLLAPSENRSSFDSLLKAVRTVARASFGKGRAQGVKGKRQSDGSGREMGRSGKRRRLGLGWGRRMSQMLAGSTSASANVMEEWTARYERRRELAGNWQDPVVLERLLREQELVDPVEIFGSPQTSLEMDEVFGGEWGPLERDWRRERRGSGDWSVDGITDEERREDFERRLGMVVNGGLRVAGGEVECARFDGGGVDIDVSEDEEIEDIANEKVEVDGKVWVCWDPFYKCGVWKEK